MTIQIQKSQITNAQAENLQNGSSLTSSRSSSQETFNSNEINKFVRRQLSSDAHHTRLSLDFSNGQILSDPKDKKIGSNTISDGVVSIKPHGSSYFSRISKNNFTSQGKEGYIGVRDHVMTFLDNSLYDGLTSVEAVSGYSKYIYNIIQNSHSYQQKIDKNPQYKTNTWTYLEPENEIPKRRNINAEKVRRYLTINGKNYEQNNETRVYAIENALQKNPENFKVKSFIENGRFGHQNNCAVITNALLVLKSAYGNEERVDEALFSLIAKAHKIDEIRIKKTKIDGIEVEESEPRLDVKSVRAFLGTFLSVKALYLSKGIDIIEDQTLYTEIVEKLVDNFKPLEKGIKDDVNNSLFWNVYQKNQLEEFFEVKHNKNRRANLSRSSEGSETDHKGFSKY